MTFRLGRGEPLRSALALWQPKGSPNGTINGQLEPARVLPLVQQVDPLAQTGNLNGLGAGWIGERKLLDVLGDEAAAAA